MELVKSQAKLWQKNYPKGVPFEVDADAYPSVVEMFEEACQRFGPKTSFSCMGHSFTFGELETQSQSFAAFLQSIPGLVPGDRIAIQMPNLLQYPIALYGALRAGLVVVNTNPLYTPREMEFQFKDSGAKLVVICANFACHLQEVLARTDVKTVVITEIGDLFPTPKRLLVNAVIRYVKRMVPRYHIPGAISLRKSLAKGKGLAFKRVARKGEDLAFIQYTGGTTGISKGAMLTHRNIIANTEQVGAWMKPKLKEGEDVCLAPLPLYHVFSLVVNAMAFLNKGAHNVLITNPRDIPAFIKLMQSQALRS